MPPARWAPKKATKYSRPVGSMIPTAAPGPTPEPGEAGGHRADPPRQLAVGQLLGLAVAGIEEDVPPLGMALGVPVEHLEQGARAVRRRLARCRAERQSRSPAPAAAAGCATASAWRRSRGVSARAQQVLGEAHAERPLQAGEELDPAEAVEARGRAPARRRGRARAAGRCGCSSRASPSTISSTAAGDGGSWAAAESMGGGERTDIPGMLSPIPPSGGTRGRGETFFAFRTL